MVSSSSEAVIAWIGEAHPSQGKTAGFRGLRGIEEPLKRCRIKVRETRVVVAAGVCFRF